MLFLLLLLDYYTYYQGILGTFYDIWGQKVTFNYLEASSLIGNILILWVNGQLYKGAKIIVIATFLRG